MDPSASLVPPAPPGVPLDLAKPGIRYRLLVVGVLLALFLFLLVYIAFLAGAVFLLGWALFPPAEVAALPEGAAAHVFLTLVRLGIFGIAAMLFGFLFKGFFKREEDPALHYHEIHQHQQPELFEFIQAVCREVGSLAPARVFLNHEVNAAVLFPTSIVNLVVPARKDLLVGLGLIHDLDVVEFKAVLAHEFGHFSQRSLRLSGYTLLVYRVLHNIVYARDRWDNWIVRGFDIPWLSAFAVPLSMLVDGMRNLLAWIFRLLDIAHLALRRQMELNADLVAVGAAGSDALVSLLSKSESCHRAQTEALRDLARAAEHQLFTRDLVFHQVRAAQVLRDRPHDHLDQAMQEDHPAMWADHPSNELREQNARRTYFPSPRDERPAWLLLREPEKACAEAASLYYRLVLGIDPLELAVPERVQEFIDEERAALTFDERYHGIYDSRLLELADLDQLIRDVQRRTPPPAHELIAALDDLYKDTLQEGLNDKRRSDREHLARFDCSVFSLHWQLAGTMGKTDDLKARYAFHLELQRLCQMAGAAQGGVDWVLRFLSTRREVAWEEVHKVKETLAQACDWLRVLLREANDLVVPALKHEAAGETLARLLPSEQEIPDLSTADTALDLGLLRDLQQLIGLVMDRLTRLLFKSLGGILAFQEGLVRECAAQPPAAMVAEVSEPTME